jgi:hypothetical protein
MLISRLLIGYQLQTQIGASLESMNKFANPWKEISLPPELTNMRSMLSEEEEQYCLANGRKVRRLSNCGPGTLAGQ